MRYFFRRNILDSQSDDFVKKCRYNSTDKEAKYCPIFRLGTIVEEAGVNYDKLALKVGHVGLLHYKLIYQSHEL